MDSGLLSLEEVLAEAERMDLDVSERTFRYYSVLGLLPRPVKRPPGSGDGRVHFYESAILDRLRQIRNLQAAGNSLKQVKVMLEARGESPLIRSLADGRFQQACQEFLQTPATQLREASTLLVEQLQAMLGESYVEMSAREFDACLRQLSQWHGRHNRVAENPASGCDQIASKIRALELEEPSARQVQARLLELLSRGSLPDTESLLTLRRLLASRSRG